MNKRMILSVLLLLLFMLGVSFGISRLISTVDTSPLSRAEKSSYLPDQKPEPITMETAGNSAEASISLPSPEMKGAMSLEEALMKRRSVRKYADTPLTLQQVSQLLWAAYGISDSTTYSRLKLRTAPSAGAVYPLELYLMVRHVTGLAAGLYKYTSNSHTLELISEGDISKAVAEACLDQMMLHQAPATLIYTAVWGRIKARYGDRGAERYLCMDIGHSAQNVYLQATASGMATCAIGAFNDKKLDAIVNPPDGEQVMYLLPVGYPAL